MTTINANVIRRTVANAVDLKSGPLILANGQWGYATVDGLLVIRDLAGVFHDITTTEGLDELIESLSYCKAPVANILLLPPSDPIGTIRFSINANTYYVKNSSNLWELLVPVVDLSGKADIINGVIPCKAIEFDLDDGHQVTEGQLTWNPTDHTLDLGMESGVVQQIGQEFYIRAHNETGATILNGKAVRVTSSGTPDGHLHIELADKATAGGDKVIAVATQDIPDGEMGLCTKYGAVRGLDTSMLVEGEKVYLSTAGGLSSTPGVWPDYKTVIGYCMMSNSTTGSIYVSVDNSNDLEQLHDVDIQAIPSDGSSLIYENGRWTGKNFGDISKEVTGFVSPESIIVTYSVANRTVTLTGPVAAYWRSLTVDPLVTGWVSEPHLTGRTTTQYLWYNGSAFVWSDGIPWTFDLLQIAAVVFSPAGVFITAIRECHSTMQWQSHNEFHRTIGCYLSAGGDIPSASYTLNSYTATNRRPNIDATYLADEDLPSTLPALTSKLYTRFNLTGTSTMVFTTGQSEMVSVTGAIPNWNQFNGSTWVQTPMLKDEYAAIFVLAVPSTSDTESQNIRYTFIQPQSVSEDLLTIQNLTPNSINLNGFSALNPELCYINKIIIRYDGPSANNWLIYSVEKLVGTKISQTAVTGVFLSSVAVDGVTITGNGTTGSPISVIPASTTGTILTGFVTDGNTAITNTDSIEIAFEKTQGQLDDKVSKSVVTLQTMASSLQLNNINTAGGITYRGTDSYLIANSADGADTYAFVLNGGGGNTDPARGAYVTVRGNEKATTGGTLTLAAGNGIEGDIIATTGAGTERLRISKAGLITALSSITVKMTNTTDYAFGVAIPTDTFSRLAITAGGVLEMGAGGATARDVNLYRSAANILKTDDSFIALNVDAGLVHLGTHSLYPTFAQMSHTSFANVANTLGMGFTHNSSGNCQINSATSATIVVAGLAAITASTTAVTIDKTLNVSTLTASQWVKTDASKNLVSSTLNLIDIGNMSALMRDANDSATAADFINTMGGTGGKWASTQIPDLSAAYIPVTAIANNIIPKMASNGDTLATSSISDDGTLVTITNKVKVEAQGLQWATNHFMQELASATPTGFGASTITSVNNVTTVAGNTLPVHHFRGTQDANWDMTIGIFNSGGTAIDWHAYLSNSASKFKIGNGLANWASFSSTELLTTTPVKVTAPGADATVTVVGGTSKASYMGFLSADGATYNGAVGKLGTGSAIYLQNVVANADIVFQTKSAGGTDEIVFKSNNVETTSYKTMVAPSYKLLNAETSITYGGNSSLTLVAGSRYILTATAMAVVTLSGMADGESCYIAMTTVGAGFTISFPNEFSGTSTRIVTYSAARFQMIKCSTGYMCIGSTNN